MMMLNAVLDLPSGTLSGEFDVLADYRDGSGDRCVDLGRNGRRLCCGYVIETHHALPIPDLRNAHKTDARRLTASGDRARRGDAESLAGERLVDFVDGRGLVAERDGSSSDAVAARRLGAEPATSQLVATQPVVVAAISAAAADVAVTLRDSAPSREPLDVSREVAEARRADTQLAERSCWPELVRRVADLGCEITKGPDAVGSFNGTTPGGKSFLIYTGPLQHERRMLFTLTPDGSMTFVELARKIADSKSQISNLTSQIPVLKSQPREPVPTFRTGAVNVLFG